MDIKRVSLERTDFAKERDFDPKALEFDPKKYERKESPEAKISAASSMVKQTEIPINEPDAIAAWVWKNLVPQAGQSAWVQGELLRCVEKLRWEAQNNGNINWDAGFELIADYLEETLGNESSFSEEERSSIRKDMGRLQHYRMPYTEDDLYDRLTDKVVAFCQQHPALIPKPPNSDLLR